MSVSTNMDLPVKQGGTRIRDFEDLRIAFLDLQKKHNDLVDKHNGLANDYRNYRNEYKDRDVNDRTYGL